MRQYTRGDTIIEVLLAMTIFSAVVSSAMFVMNRSIGSAQRSLEITQVRAQIDTQVELLRHINSVAIVNIDPARTNSSTSNIANSWQQIRSASFTSGDTIPAFDRVREIKDCSPEGAIPSSLRNGSRVNAFFIDPRTGQVELVNTTDVRPNIITPTTFARVVQEASGGAGTSRPVSHMVWIYAIRVGEPVRDLQGGASGTQPLSSHYDFHVRACWQSPVGGGLQRMGTVVRLYAPEA